MSSSGQVDRFPGTPGRVGLVERWPQVPQVREDPGHQARWARLADHAWVTMKVQLDHSTDVETEVHRAWGASCMTVPYDPK